MEPYWTPDSVADEMVDAIRWAQRTGGRTGPAGMSSVMPVFAYDKDDLAAQDELPKEDVPARRPTSPTAVTRYEAALYWPAVYLYALPGPRRVLRIWLKAKATRQPFNRLCKARGWSLATAKRARTKALAAIAVGLTNDGVPLP